MFRADDLFCVIKCLKSFILKKVIFFHYHDANSPKMNEDQQNLKNYFKVVKRSDANKEESLQDNSLKDERSVRTSTAAKKVCESPQNVSKRNRKRNIASTKGSCPGTSQLEPNKQKNDQTDVAEFICKKPYSIFSLLSSKGKQKYRNFDGLHENKTLFESSKRNFVIKQQNALKSEDDNNRNYIPEETQTCQQQSSNNELTLTEQFKENECNEIISKCETTNKRKVRFSAADNSKDKIKKRKIESKLKKYDDIFQDVQKWKHETEMDLLKLKAIAKESLIQYKNVNSPKAEVNDDADTADKESIIFESFYEDLKKSNWSVDRQDLDMKLKAKNYDILQMIKLKVPIKKNLQALGSNVNNDDKDYCDNEELFCSPRFKCNYGIERFELLDLKTSPNNSDSGEKTDILKKMQEPVTDLSSKQTSTTLQSLKNQLIDEQSRFLAFDKIQKATVVQESKRNKLSDVQMKPPSTKIINPKDNEEIKSSYVYPTLSEQMHEMSIRKALKKTNQESAFYLETNGVGVNKEGNISYPEASNSSKVVPNLSDMMLDMKMRKTIKESNNEAAFHLKTNYVISAEPSTSTKVNPNLSDLMLGMKIRKAKNAQEALSHPENNQIPRPPIENVKIRMDEKESFLKPSTSTNSNWYQRMRNANEESSNVYNHNFIQNMEVDNPSTSLKTGCKYDQQDTEMKELQLPSTSKNVPLLTKLESSTSSFQFYTNVLQEMKFKKSKPELQKTSSPIINIAKETRNEVFKKPIETFSQLYMNSSKADHTESQTVLKETTIQELRKEPPTLSQRFGDSFGKEYTNSQNQTYNGPSTLSSSILKENTNINRSLKSADVYKELSAEQQLKDILEKDPFSLGSENVPPTIESYPDCLTQFLSCNEVNTNRKMNVSTQIMLSTATKETENQSSDQPSNFNVSYNAKYWLADKDVYKILWDNYEKCKRSESRYQVPSHTERITCAVQRFKKGDVKIYRLKKLKKEVKNVAESNTTLTCEELLEEMSQTLYEKNRLIKKHPSGSSMTTNTSYIPDDGNFDVFSTGSKKLPRAQQKVRQGLNEVCQDELLLCSEIEFEDVKEDSREIMILKIENILLKIFEIFSANDKIEIPYRSRDATNLIFKDNMWQIKSVAEAKQSRASSTSSNFKLLILIMNLILSNLESNTKITHREIYYQLKQFVKSYDQVRSIINKITWILDVGVWSLNIIAQKGLVFGDMRIILSSGECINCNVPGTLIPQDVTDIIEIHSKTYFILVVEKESIYAKLIEENLHNKLTRPFILITGKGYPDLATQLFVKKIWSVMSIPVFILTDADPHGVKIMMNYRFGSLNNAHVSKYLAVPNAKWFGFYPSEIESFGKVTHPMTSTDMKIVKDLLNWSCVQQYPKIAEELRIFEKTGRKAGIEDLMKTENYLSDVYIPTKLFKHDFI